MPAPRARFPRLRAPRQRKGSGRPLNSCPRNPPPSSGGPARSTAPTLCYTSPDRAPSLSACSNALSKTMTSPSSAPKKSSSIPFSSAANDYCQLSEAVTPGTPQAAASINPFVTSYCGAASASKRQRPVASPSPGNPRSTDAPTPPFNTGRSKSSPALDALLAAPQIATILPLQALRRCLSLRPLLPCGRLPFVLRFPSAFPPCTLGKIFCLCLSRKSACPYPCSSVVPLTLPSC
jgi:hypothetical protein